MLRTILACAVFLASTDALMLPGAAPRSVQMRTAGVNMQGARRRAAPRPTSASPNSFSKDCLCS